MAAIVLETDGALSHVEDFKNAGAYLGALTTMLAKIIRDKHLRTGIGMMDLVATVDRSSLN